MNVFRKTLYVIVAIIIIFALACVALSTIHSKQAKNLGQSYTDWQRDMEIFLSDAGAIYYVDQGEGPVVVLLHGVPTSSYMYRDVIDGLVDNGMRVIAPDMIGFGASEKPKGYDIYDFDKQASRIVALLDSQEISNYSLVMHDMGGLVGAEMITQQPERLNSLVVLDTILYGDGFVKQPNFSYKNPIHRFVLSLYGSTAIGPLLVKNTLQTGLYETTMMHEDQIGYWLPVTEQGNHALTHFFTSLRDIDPLLDQVRLELDKRTIPIAILWGEQDPYLSYEQAERFASDIGLHEHWVTVLPDKGHFLAEEATNVVIETISTNVSLVSREF